MATALTLNEALRLKRLDDFIAQAEAEGVAAADAAEFNEIVGPIVKALPNPKMVEDRKSIREQADECRASIDAAKAEKETAPTRAARKSCNQRIHMLEGVEKWLRSRRGYE